MGDLEGVVKDSIIIDKDFAQGSITSIIKGVEETYELYKEVKHATCDCKLSIDWDEYDRMAEKFHNTEHFGYKSGQYLTVGEQDIYKEVKTAIKHANHNRWGAFGYKLGQAGAKVQGTKANEDELFLF